MQEAIETARGQVGKVLSRGCLPNLTPRLSVSTRRPLRPWFGQAAPSRPYAWHSPPLRVECAAPPAPGIQPTTRTVVKIIIIGAGQVGRTAAYHLARVEANEVTVVDVNDELLRDLQDRLDIRTVCGNGAHPSVLDAAGAAKADVLLALTNSDEVNMLACEVAYALYGTATKIARVRTAEYANREKLFLNAASRSMSGSAPNSSSPNTSSA